MTTRKFVLLDSNALVHRAFHALPPTLSTPQVVPTNAVYGFTSVLMKILKEMKPDHVAAAFDLAGPTFRHEEFAEYKSHRPKGPDELYEQLPIAKEVTRAFGIPVYEQAGYEADDVIGTLTEQAKRYKDLQVIIVTGDLDTLQHADSSVIVSAPERGQRHGHLRQKGVKSAGAISADARLQGLVGIRRIISPYLASARSLLKSS
jgi:DNA polymerase-1